MGQAFFGPAQMVDPAPRKKKKKEDLLGRDRPNHFRPYRSTLLGLISAQLIGPAQPTYLILYYNIILKKPKIPKEIQKILSKICDFLKYFPTNFA